MLIEERQLRAALLLSLADVLSPRAARRLRVSAETMFWHGVWAPQPAIGSVRLEVKTRLEEAFLTGKLER